MQDSSIDPSFYLKILKNMILRAGDLRAKFSKIWKSKHLFSIFGICFGSIWIACLSLKFEEKLFPVCLICLDVQRDRLEFSTMLPVSWEHRQ